MADDIYTRCILEYIQNHEGQNIFIPDIAQFYNVSRSTIDRKLKALKDSGRIVKQGFRYFIKNKN